MTFWVKESSGLSIVDRSLEAPLDGQDGYLTPNDRFFVCNSGTTPIIEAAEHVVGVHGDGETRATDRRGSTQPASVPFNHGGYLFNAVHPHPAIVD